MRRGVELDEGDRRCWAEWSDGESNERVCGVHTPEGDVDHDHLAVASCLSRAHTQYLLCSCGMVGLHDASTGVGVGVGVGVGDGGGGGSGLQRRGDAMAAMGS